MNNMNNKNKNIKEVLICNKNNDKWHQLMSYIQKP